MNDEPMMRIVPFRIRPDGWIVVYLPCGCEGLYDPQRWLVVALRCEEHDR